MHSRATFCSFAGFGLLNNLLYVVILSAAIDLVGPTTPKGLVLLADVFPSFVFKVSAPFYFHRCPYEARVLLVVAFSVIGMLVVALGGALPLRLLGIVLASFSSGIGEVSFLQLAHYYDSTAINAWSSGTGGAGLAGSFLYMLLTSWMRLSPRSALLLFSFMPLFIAGIYKYVLPKPYIESTSVSAPQAVPSLTSGGVLRQRAAQLRGLAVPFILPLMTVYTAEYVINQGVSPTLLFDLLDMPMFRDYRDAYVMYSTLYQVGVFISRSSGSVLRIRRLWLLAALQTANVAVAIAQSLFMFNKSVYLNFAFMLYEGLLGGAAYVNTYTSIMERMSGAEREFALGAVSMSDSSGIVLAAFMSMPLERALCGFQVDRGRPWCTI